jgi:hypothetical protein
VSRQRKYGNKAGPELGKEPENRKAQAIALFGPVGTTDKGSAAELSNGLCSLPLHWSLSQSVENARKAGANTVALPEGGRITCICSFPAAPESFTDLFEFERHTGGEKDKAFFAKLNQKIRCELCDFDFNSVATKERHIQSEEHQELRSLLSEGEKFLDPSSGANVPLNLVSPRVLKKRRTESPLHILGKQISDKLGTGLVKKN